MVLDYSVQNDNFFVCNCQISDKNLSDIGIQKKPSDNKIPWYVINFQIPRFFQPFSRFCGNPGYKFSLGHMWD